MTHSTGSLVFTFLTTFGLACGGSGLKSGGPGQGGQSGTSTAGGGPGSGGAGAGGVLAGSGGGSGGSTQGAGGSLAGGSIGAGGSVAGGRGGANAGGSAAGGISGAGGNLCPTVGVCPPVVCLYGEIPNPEPCGCPTCAPPDAGAGKDSSVDGPCLALPCAMPLCAPGYHIESPPCGCPTCVPVDAGPSDAIICPLIACPAIACANGSVPNPDPCGCPLCAPADAAADSGKLACVGLDECACFAANGCSAISDACYCPFPQCDRTGACICGGGRFIGCAPAELTTCTAAKARVSALCPQVHGATFDSLCQQSDNACITKCLNEVGSCGDVGCAFCETCDCAGGNYSTCVAKCRSSLPHD